MNCPPFTSGALLPEPLHQTFDCTYSPDWCRYGLENGSEGADGAFCPATDTSAILIPVAIFPQGHFLGWRFFFHPGMALGKLGFGDGEGHPAGVIVVCGGICPYESECEMYLRRAGDCTYRMRRRGVA